METGQPAETSWTPDTIVDAIIQDLARGEVMNRRIETVIREGETIYRCHAPGDLVPPVEVTSGSDEVRWNALRVYVAMQNQEAQLRHLPEARRRRERRETELKRQQIMARRESTGEQCERCAGGGEAEDREGNWVTCPVCGGRGMV